MANQELFPWNPEWLKIPGMVEYDPAIHGYREEVARQMGLAAPTVTAPPAVEAAVEAVEPEAVEPEVAKTAAKAKQKRAAAAVELGLAQTAPAEPDLSNAFDDK